MVFEFIAVAAASPQAITCNCGSSPIAASWFYSPGFGGVATLLAAIIAYLAVRNQAAATKEAQRIAATETARHSDRLRNEDKEAVRRDLRVRLKMVFSAADNAFQNDTPDDRRVTAVPLKEFAARILQDGEDLPDALTETQLGMMRSAASVLNTVPTAWELAPDVAKMMAGFAALTTAYALFSLGGSIADLQPSEALRSSDVWARVQQHEEKHPSKKPS
jgi:phosphate/sulfate permease